MHFGEYSTEDWSQVLTTENETETQMLLRIQPSCKLTKSLQGQASSQRKIEVPSLQFELGFHTMIDQLIAPGPGMLCIVC
ncbi:Ubiquitin hydrolase B [Galdieria sulphuraria]|nr:Ubiquitin hydrolase B [Galdieria sulphuraria]